MSLSRPETEKATNFESAARLIMKDLRSRVGMDSWVVSRRDGDDHVILSVLDDYFGIDPHVSHPWDESFCAPVADGRAPMTAPDVNQVPAFAQAQRLSGIDAQSFASVPIPSPIGEPLGMLSAYGSEVHSGLHAFLPVIQLQAEILGIVLTHELHLAEEIRRAERAEEASQVDPLTGAGSRRAWDTALMAEESRASRYGTTASIVILDLDGLKQVNETWGHDAGDRVLAKTAEELRSRLRAVDMSARLGSDVFGILLPQTALPGAQALADELIHRLAEAGIGASAGVAQRRADSGLAGAWRTADALMHANKQGVRPPLAVREATLAATVTLEAVPFKNVDAVLSLVQEQLGVEGAFVRRFDGTKGYFRNIAGPRELEQLAGTTEPLESTICSLIVSGQVEQVIPDVMAHPLTRDLPSGAIGPIGAYIGVPLYDAGGEVYGTLCAFSPSPHPHFGARDSRVLRALGNVLMTLVDSEDQDDKQRHAFLRRMDAVIAGGGPDVVYQPIHNLETLQVVGFEALSRFPAGTPSPAEWFLEAAAHGAGADLEFAALKSALATLPALRGIISLNISPATILLPEFLRMFSSMPLDRFVLEITEHEEINDYESVAAVLQPMRADGLRIAVDDAGAGFASMHHILALVPDFIKLDISLVRGIDTHPARQALAASLAAFGFQTGATLIAEGIETAEELLCLRQLQIQFGQGYHLSRPSAQTDQWGE